MPSSLAFSYLLPGSAPTTTYCVFLDTLAATLPPAALMRSAACSRLKVGNVPVSTKAGAGQGARLYRRLDRLPSDAGNYQLVDHVAVVWFTEELRYALRNDRPDIRHFFEPGLIGAHQHLHIPEGARQIARGGLPDIADAERIDEARECRVAAAIDGSHQVGRGLLAHALELGQRGCVKP